MNIYDLYLSHVIIQLPANMTCQSYIHQDTTLEAKELCTGVCDEWAIPDPAGP